MFIADKNKGAEKTLTGASARNALEADDDEESGDEEEDLQRLWGESLRAIFFCTNTSLLCIASAEKQMKKMRYMRDLR